MSSKIIMIAKITIEKTNYDEKIANARGENHNHL